MSMHRCVLLLRRFLRARELGFRFLGTTKSKLPSRVRLGERVIKLEYPDDGGYLPDLVNLWLDDEYGLRELDSPATVVDIGGNIGLFSLWAWHLFPHARLFTYEPNPKVWDCLEQNLAPTSTCIFKAAVSYHAGRALMTSPAESRNARTTVVEEGDIEVVSLSQVVDRAGGSIDLLKMDCEGAEWDIFQDREAFRTIHRIRMEYHLTGDNSVEKLKAVTGSLGYRMTHLVPNRDFGIAWFEQR